MSLANIFLSPVVAVWALIGVGAGLAVSQVADMFTARRRLADSPRIPRRALWLALVTACLFGLAGWQFGLTPRGALSCVYIALLLLLAVTDLEHRLIPHAIILPAILIALTAGFFVDWMTWKAALLGGVIGLVAACLGDRGPMTYKRSRRGDAEIDRAVVHVLGHSGEPHTGQVLR